jgi:hypothetical protein
VGDDYGDDCCCSSLHYHYINGFDVDGVVVVVVDDCYNDNDVVD